MTVKLATINHGDSGWDAKENSNFEALNQDTGWVYLTLLASAKSMYDAQPAPRARRINGVVHLIGGLVATEDIPAGTIVADLPEIFSPLEGNSLETAVRTNVSAEELLIDITATGVRTSKDLSAGTGLELSGLTYLGKDV